MATTRIYLVTPCQNARLAPKTGPVLIEATHPNAALKIVTDGLFAVSVPTSSDVVRLMQSGVNVVREGGGVEPARDVVVEDVAE